MLCPNTNVEEAKKQTRKNKKHHQTKKTKENNDVKKCRKWLQQEKTKLSVAKECENVTTPLSKTKQKQNPQPSFIKSSLKASL